MASSDWYYAKGNCQMGPVSSTELKQLSESGKLVADDLVWREGMPEWISAAKVKGLFGAPVEEPARVESPPVQTLRDVAAPSGFAPPPAEPQSLAPRKHPFDMLIELIRRQFSARFVDSSSQFFSVVGHYGLFVGMAMLLVQALVVGLKTHTLPILLAASVANILVLVVLQYACGKFLTSLETLNRSTSGRVSSTTVPDCFALLSMAAGPTLLALMVTAALPLGSFTMILLAIGAFILCEFVAILSLRPETLNIKVEPDVSAGEESLGVGSFLAKLILRIAPVAYGLGVAISVCGLIVVSARAVSDSGLEVRAADASGTEESAASDFETRMRDMEAGWEKLESDESAASSFGLQVGPMVALDAMISGQLLLLSPVLPIIAYVYFLMAYLFIDVLQSILKMPRLLQKDGNDGNDDNDGNDGNDDSDDNDEQSPSKTAPMSTRPL